MLPPTVVSLEQLAGFGSAAAFLADRPVVAKVLPVLVVGRRRHPGAAHRAPLTLAPPAGARPRACRPEQAADDEPVEVRWPARRRRSGRVCPSVGAEGGSPGTRPSRTSRHERRAQRTQGGSPMTSSNENRSDE